MTVTITTMFYRVFFSYRKHISETDYSKVKVVKDSIDIRYIRKDNDPVNENEILKIAHNEVNKHLCYLKSDITSLRYLGCEQKEYTV